MSGGGHWQRSSEDSLGALTHCEEQIRRLYAESLELIAELDSRDTAASLGYSGLAELLRDVVRLSTAEARRRISHATAVTETPLVSGGVVPPRLPVVAAALREGVLGSDHVDVITRTVQGLPLHVAGADRSVAEHALVDAAHAGPDPRSAAERHGDALVEVFRLVADEGALPTEGGEKPHILVTIPLETLRTTHTTRTAAGHDGPTDVQPHCHNSSGGHLRHGQRRGALQDLDHDKPPARAISG